MATTDPLDDEKPGTHKGFYVRQIPISIRTKLERKAKSEGMSVSQWIGSLLIAANYSPVTIDYTVTQEQPSLPTMGEEPAEPAKEAPKS